MVGEQTTNHDVKSLGLDLFQQWALTYTTKDELTYLVESYHSLKHSGASPSPVLLLSSSVPHLLTSTFTKENRELNQSKILVSNLNSPRPLLPPSSTLDLPLLNPSLHLHLLPPTLARLPPLHTLPNPLFLHKPKTPLSKLRSRLRSGLLGEDDGATLVWREGGSEGV